MITRLEGTDQLIDHRISSGAVMYTDALNNPVDWSREQSRSIPVETPKSVYIDTTAEIDGLKQHLKMLEAMIPRQRADPVVICMHCEQPTLYDRPCRQCGGPPEKTI